MRQAVRVYVFFIAVCAAIALFALWRIDPHFDSRFVQAAVCFTTLGILAQALKYQLARAASGSIAFMPFLAVASLAPSWTSVVAALLATGASEAFAKRSPIKGIFNTAQYTLATAVSILVYRGTGGLPLLDGAPPSARVMLGLSTVFAVFMLTNWTAVSSVVALNERRNVWAVWRENTLNTVVYDLFSLPMLFAFVYVYVHLGPLGAVVLTVPILGIRQLYKINWQLEKTNQELLQLMVAAIEARDPYTSGHSRRVAQYSRVIARAIGMSGKAVERVGVAALLHDVGKIHEAFAPLLRKPGKLTAEEQALMETHSIKSAELVANVSQLKDVVAAIRHHHENWDGSGYPDGISGESIPIASRIIMFADTIDAMTTDRPYRAALGPDDVRAELIKWRGRQFDPQICDLLLGSSLFNELFARRPGTPIRLTAIAEKLPVRASA